MLPSSTLNQALNNPIVDDILKKFNGLDKSELAQELIRTLGSLVGDQKVKSVPENVPNPEEKPKCEQVERDCPQNDIESIKINQWTQEAPPELSPLIHPDNTKRETIVQFEPTAEKSLCHIEEDDDSDEPHRNIGWVPPPPLMPHEFPPCPPPNTTTNNDISKYLQKKSMAQGMMDLALLSANTNQLRYTLDSRLTHQYFYVSLGLITLSLILQIAVGLSLIWSSRVNFKKKNELKSADRINNISVIGVFLITVINVFISTFGGSSQVGMSAATGTAEEMGMDDPVVDVEPVEDIIVPD